MKKNQTKPEGTYDLSHVEKKKYQVQVGLESADAVEALMDWAGIYCDENKKESIGMKGLNPETTNTMNLVGVPVDKDGDELD